MFDARRWRICWWDWRVWEICAGEGVEDEEEEEEEEEGREERAIDSSCF